MYLYSTRGITGLVSDDSLRVLLKLPLLELIFHELLTLFDFLKEPLIDSLDTVSKGLEGI